MKSKSIWTQQFQSVANNGRNHSIVMDLPEEKGGSNNGATALEVCLMSFSGCVGTIFAMVAAKMRLSFDKMEVEAVAEQKNNAGTFTDVHYIFSIKTEASIDKIEKCLEHTEKTCPVGLLYNQAGVKITHEIKLI